MKFKFLGSKKSTSTTQTQASPQHPSGPPIPVDLSKGPKTFWWGQDLCSGIVPLHVVNDDFFKGKSIDVSLLEKILSKSRSAIKDALTLDVQPWQIAALLGMSALLDERYGNKLEDLKDGFGYGVLEYYILGGHDRLVEKWLTSKPQKLTQQQVYRLAELAAGTGNQYILEFLKNHYQFDITFFDAQHQQTLLHRATRCGQKKIVQWLLKQGVDPTKGHNIALVAAENNHWDLYSDFVKLKIVPRNAEELNALLIYAARSGKNAIITKLASSIGDDINLVRFAGLDMVASATYGGQLETIEFCWGRKCGSVTQRWDNNMAIIHVAAFKGQVKLIYDLLQKYPDHLWCDMTDDLGRTILFFAARHGDWDAFYSLANSYFRAGDILKADKNGETIVHAAASYGRLLFLQQLLQYAEKACLQQRDNLGRTPLHHACTSGNSALIICLVKEQGLSLSETDKQQNTPLHILAQQAKQDAYLWNDLVLLAETFGAEVITEPRDQQGKTPLDYLKEAKQPELLQRVETLIKAPFL